MSRFIQWLRRRGSRPLHSKQEETYTCTHMHEHMHILIRNVIDFSLNPGQATSFTASEPPHSLSLATTGMSTLGVLILSVLCI